MLEIEYVHPKNFQNIIIFYYYYFSFLATIRRGLHRTQFSLLLAILSLFHFSSIFFFVFTVLFGAFNLRLAAVSVLGVCLFHCVRMNFDIFFFFLVATSSPFIAPPSLVAHHMRCEASKYAFFFYFVSVIFSSESNTVWIMNPWF